MVRPNTIFPVSIGRDENGRLTVAGHAVPALAEKFGTPLYVYDGATIRAHIEGLRAALDAHYPASYEISYAAKAYFSLGFARKLAHMGLGVEVSSLQEMRLASRAGFRSTRVHLHGNNKSELELSEALDESIQAIVIDNLEELDFVDVLAWEKGKRAQVWLRLTPELEAGAHPALRTGNAHSKFGLPISNGSAGEAIQRVMTSRSLHLTGLHFHLGSQVFDVEPYCKALKTMIELSAEAGLVLRELSPGGGWGVPYTLEDRDADVTVWIKGMSEVIREEYEKRKWRLPKLVIEPGRWIAARAGMAIYTVGWSRKAADGTTVIAVDGGMADNIRPALYQARYTCVVAERPTAAVTERVRIVGKFCESGDELIADTWLTDVEPGEHLVMPVAGAYQLSLASNYNLAPRPQVIWVEAGKTEVLQRRENPEENGWWMGE